MSFRSRGTRDERTAKRTTARRTGYGAPQSRQSEAPSLLWPFLAGIAFAAAVLYISGWDFTGRAGKPPSIVPKVRLDPGLPARADRDKSEGVRATLSGDAPTDDANTGGNTPADTEWTEQNLKHAFSLVDEQHLFDEGDAAVVHEALKKYRSFASSTLEADERAVRDGQPLQGKYIVLDSGNELVNRLRGVLSGFFLGILTDRVFVADITYQKDTNGGLLSALFEGPGYQWDLSRLSPALRRALGSEKQPYVRGAGGGLSFEMSEGHFRRWVCEDVLGGQLSSTSVVTLSTVVYPFPLLARNPSYAAHPILSGGSSASGFAGGGQARIEALETLLTRAVLRPTLELRERAGRLVEEVRQAARAWGAERGVNGPVRVVGLHVRTYFVKAVAEGSLESNLKQFEDCAVAGGVSAEDDKDKDRDDVFYFVATDEAATQALASKVWGNGCYFVPFALPGRRLEGIKAAFVDLLVMGSLDDYVMTPHSSFSELGSTLSFTWLPDLEAMRTRPNRPIVPFFPSMNDFERRKVMSLLDRRGSLVDGGRGACVRAHAAGMSLAIAIGKRLTSMFEAIEHAPCLEGWRSIADP